MIHRVGTSIAKGFDTSMFSVTSAPQQNMDWRECVAQHLPWGGPKSWKAKKGVQTACLP
jgi:hypothetical protein